MLRMKNLDEMVRELDLRRRQTSHEEPMDDDLRKAAESTRSDIDKAFKKLGKIGAKLKRTKAA
jgi:hypothetical protein